MIAAHTVVFTVIMPRILDRGQEVRPKWKFPHDQWENFPANVLLEWKNARSHTLALNFTLSEAGSPSLHSANGNHCIPSAPGPFLRTGRRIR